MIRFFNLHNHIIYIKHILGGKRMIYMLHKFQRIHPDPGRIRLLKAGSVTNFMLRLGRTLSLFGLLASDTKQASHLICMP
jgi:hypothetical protein